MEANQPEPSPDIAAHVATRRSALPDHLRSTLSDRPWGLALSGGGIRSATFCFGVLKALAGRGLLARFDILSTVSGGGYIGATVGKLYQNEASAPSPDPIAVERALADADTRWFAAWLRANGRYLIPRGAKDAFQAASNFGRNFFGVHVEIAMLSLILGGALVLIDLLAWQWADCIYTRGSCWGIERGEGKLLGFLSRFPPVFALLLPLGWLAAVACCAYWALPKRKRRPLELSRLVAAAVMAAAFAVLLRHATPHPEWLPRRTGSVELPLALVAAALALLAAWVVGALIAAALALPPGRSLDWARNKLNTALSLCVWVAAGVIGLGAIDQLAWWVGNLDDTAQASFGFGVLVVAAALRVALPKIADLPKSLAPSSRRVVMALISFAGGIVLALTVVFWAALVHRATSGALFGTKPAELRFELAWQWLAWLALPPLLLALLSMSNREFMNRSSLYTFYRARLVRSYLGAANCQRFSPGGDDPTTARQEVDAGRSPRDVADIDPDDDLPMADYAPHRAGGPVHLINVCVNQTREPKGGLFNQDRKGLPLTIGPNGQARGSGAGWQAPNAEARMTLGSWTAISGAAIAPGLGASTRSGIATILTLAGLRLGYWWDSASLPPRPGRPPRRGSWLGKYGQILSELRGRFDGDARRYWFLSDGGHFENTAAYALLREECEVIVVADCGADPRYAFADLENLVRKARIDLQAEITFLRPADARWELAAFGSLNELASAESDAALALARVDYRRTGRRGHIFIVKPNMSRRAAVDLVNFKSDNPLFPQEPTTDQFFSEAQWESYFQLGSLLGRELTLAPMREADAFATAFFKDDDGAILVQGEDGKRSIRTPTKRLSSRVAATGAVSASISLGAIASLGLAAWQGASSEISAGARQAAIDPAAYKELADIFGKMPPRSAAAAPSASGAAPSAQADADPRLGEMATALLRVGDAQCNERNTDAFRASKLMRLMIDSTRAACDSAASQHPSCHNLRIDADLPPCLQQAPRNVCRPMYWTRDYADSTDAAANCITPAAASAEPAASATASPRTPPPLLALPCDGRTVYTQIYGGELRDYARGLGDALRRLGAAVPAIEDVNDSARRAGRRPPQPYPRSTVLFHEESAKRCVEALIEEAGDPSWQAKPLEGSSAAQRQAIEVWLAPPARAADALGLEELVLALDAPTKPERVAALSRLQGRHGADARAVSLVLALLQPPRLESLTAKGRVNALVFLRNTQPVAWDARSAGRALDAVSFVRARGASGVAIGAETDAELSKLAAFLRSQKWPDAPAGRE